MLKRLILLIGIVVCIAIFYSLGKQITDSLQAGSRVDAEVEKLTQLQKKNEELKNRLSEVNSLPFLEAQARNKFNMARNGETVVVIPQEEIDKILGAQKQVILEKIPNWQGWLRLFVGAN